MTFQTDAPLTHLTMDASNRMAREVANMVINGDMDPAPAYQRPSVWTRTQQINLVRSWLTGLPVPAIIINDRTHTTWTDPRLGDEMYVVVDGRQRVETAAAWFGGDLAVPASWFPAEHVIAPHG